MAASTDTGKRDAVNFTVENNILKGTVEIVDNEHKLGPMILDAFNKNPDHVSQIDAETGIQTTFAEMKDKSIRCALWLKKLEIGPNDIVIACTHNHLDAYIPVFATLFVDAIFSAWNHNITIYTARRFMKQFRPKVIFACEKATDVLLEAAKLENLGVQLVVFGEHSDLPSITSVINNQTEEEINNFNIVNLKSPKEIATIVLSSGSTGFPKGVMKCCKSLLSSLMKRFNLANAKQKFLWYAPLDWASGTYFLFQIVIARQTRIVPAKCEVENFFQIVEKYKVNSVLLPSYLVRCIAISKLTQNYDRTSLKVIIVGGSKHNKDTLEALKKNVPTAFISNGYAATELGVMASSTFACQNIDSVGFVASNVQLKFVDLVSGESLGPNQHGEIYAKSPSLAMGYYDDPEATKQAFGEDGWYRTGDLGYYDETGEIFIADRIKEIIKYRSFTISPAEIEEILLSHPEIEEAIVVGVPHKIDINWPVALCKKSSGSKVTEDQLMELTSVLEDYKKLRAIHFIDDFVYTSSGKIARHDMKKVAENLTKTKNES